MFDLELIQDTLELLFAGKLFRDTGFVVRQVFLGVLLAALLLVALVKIGVSITIAALITSMVSGVLQPFLLKDIKFA